MTPRRVLVTGASGYLGPHLVRALTDSWEVHGTWRCHRPPAGATDAAVWHQVSDQADALADAVSLTSPRLVVHAAFENRKPPCTSAEQYLQRLQAVNWRLFDRCTQLGVPILLVGSSAVYGAHGHQAALGEDTPRRPVSLYGMAKAMQEMLAEYFLATQGLRLSTMRLFNLIGPGRAVGTVVPDWVSRVVAIMEGAEPVLWIKNHETSRDFVDVRDAARAIGLLAPGLADGEIRNGEVYNVASGNAVSLRQVADLLERLCPVTYRSEATDARSPTSDPLAQCGDATKISNLTGWLPMIHWTRSIRDYWDQVMGQHHMDPTTANRTGSDL